MSAAEGQLRAGVEALHRPGPSVWVTEYPQPSRQQVCCAECFKPYPCPTADLLAAPAPTPDEPGQVEGLSAHEWGDLMRWWNDVWQTPRTEDQHKRNLRDVVQRILAARTEATR